MVRQEEENDLQEVEENEDVDDTKFLQVPHSSRLKLNPNSYLRSPHYYERRKSSAHSGYGEFGHPNIHVSYLIAYR